MKGTLNLEVISPDMAAALLMANQSNRTLRKAIVAKYANDMLSGVWTECLMPIAFYSDGQIADGQHRLHAVVLSGLSQEFYIRRGLSRQSALNIDTGLERSLVDSSRIVGSKFKLSERILAVSRTIETGQRVSEKLSHHKRLETAIKFREATEWAIAQFKPMRLITNAITIGAVARAWYWEEDKEKLQRYCYVLTTGFADGPSESAAVAMRNYFLTKGNGISNVYLFRENFLKAQNSIWYFMRSKPLAVVREIADEKYPLKPEQK